MKGGNIWNSDVHILHFMQIVHVVYIGKESTLMHVNSAATTAQFMFLKIHVQCS